MQKHLLLLAALFLSGPNQAQVKTTGKATTHATHTKQQFTASGISSTTAENSSSGTYSGEVVRCYTVENEAARRRENPDLPSTEVFEQWIEDKIKEQKLQQAFSPLAATVYSIPVIVHVVHNGEPIGVGPNITAAQVYSQIESLNEDLRRLNADRVNTRAIFEPVAADLEIEFVAATVDPNGNQLAEPGIRRYNGNRPSWDTRDDVEKILKPATIWDPTRYSNMWSASFGGDMAGLLGYAQFPEGSGLAGMPTGTQNSQTDGTVMVYTSFGCKTKDPGDIFNLRAPYNLGRTTTHEVGHWLGLRHIWGDGGCTVDDFVNDTPVAAASNSGCALETNSCNSRTAGDLPDMVENYMDYSNDGCMNAFTAGQKSRTTAVMLNSPRRKELPYSTVAGSTYHDAGITRVNFTKDCDGNLSGTALLTNFATRGGLTAVSIHVEVNGVVTASQNWTGNLSALRSSIISLPAVSVNMGTHAIRVYTSNPNNVADQNTQNDASSTSITTAVLSGNYTQNFEAGAASLAELVMRRNPESNYGVEAELQSKSSLSLYMEGNSANGYPAAPGGPTAEEAFNPSHSHYTAAVLCYDATTASSLLLSFDYYLNWGLQNDYTNFRYRVVSDKGTFTSAVIKPNGADVPWTRINMDLTPYVGGKIQIYFEANCKYGRSNLNGVATDGNAVYIDNIAFAYTTSLPEISFATSQGSVGEASATTADGCRTYTDYTVNLRIANAPNSDAHVQIAESSTRAAASYDYSLLTTAVVFPAGSTTAQPVIIRVYDDTEVEGDESITLGLQLSAGSDAVLATGASSHTLTITDNDTEVVADLPAGAIFSEAFTGGVPENSGWYVLDNIAAGSGNKWFFGTYNTKGAAYVASSATAAPGSYANINTNIRLVSPLVNATGRSGLVLTFDYVANGETAGGGPTLTNLDFGQTYYSLDGTSFTAIGPVLQGKTALTAASITLPAGLEGKNFYLAWNWVNNNSTSRTPALILQNIKVNAAARAGTAIAVTLNQQQSFYLGPYSTANVFDRNTGEILARIENSTDWDYGCTSVQIDRSGVASTEFWNPGAERSLADKTIYITPAKNNSTGSYTITLYYTETEIAGWEQRTGKSRDDLKVAKISGAHVYEVSPTSFPAGASGAISTSNSLNSFGSGWAISGQFSNGFSGFGIGDPGPPPIIILPVELLRFTASPVKDEVKLSWTTATEKNGDYFEVEHSTNGQTFTSVGKVSAAGNSSQMLHYNFTHRRVPWGFHYYRLRMVDTDQTYEYSKMLLVKLGSAPFALQSLYPNPARNKSMLELVMVNSGTLSLTLTNASGIKVQQKQFPLQAGLNQLELDLRGLPAGIYLLHMSNGLQSLQHKVIVH